MTATEAYGILPPYMQLRVDHVRATYRHYQVRMTPLTFLGDIMEGGSLPEGFYARHGTTVRDVSALLVEEFNASLPEPEPEPCDDRLDDYEDAKLAAADEEYHRRKEDGELW